mmetsp:Transcript_104141/g.196015  ORF Transcript_104141/g.196015 Transcript_104141/m.196015 type:complete len:298 (-) Transcript_104141:521-1414(-)
MGCVPFGAGRLAQRMPLRDAIIVRVECFPFCRWENLWLLYCDYTQPALFFWFIYSFRFLSDPLSFFDEVPTIHRANVVQISHVQDDGRRWHKVLVGDIRVRPRLQNTFVHCDVIFNLLNRNHVPAVVIWIARVCGYKISRLIHQIILHLHLVNCLAHVVLIQFLEVAGGKNINVGVNRFFVALIPVNDLSRLASAALSTIFVSSREWLAHHRHRTGHLRHVDFSFSWLLCLCANFFEQNFIGETHSFRSFRTLRFVCSRKDRIYQNGAAKQKPCEVITVTLRGAYHRLILSNALPIW